MAQKKPILQYILVSRQQIWGTRVFRDGKVEAVNELNSRGNKDEPELDANDWSPRAQLSADEVETLVEVISKSEFFDLPEQLGDRRVQDGSTIYWTLRRGDQKHEVAAIGRDAQINPVLENLRTSFEALVTEALNRDDPADEEQAEEEE